MSTTDSTTGSPASATAGTLPLHIAIANADGPRPDLNGMRVTPPQGGPIYLIDNGMRRHIPNPDTYNNLFRDWNGVFSDLNVNQIPQDRDLLDGAVLIKAANGDGKVYLMDDVGKRWIASPAVMDQYYFNWETIQELPAVVVNAVPTGPTIG